MIEQRIESQKVKSLILEAVDGGPVIDYQPGQYIGIEVQPKYHEFKEIRQYSLSDKANSQRYCISVKRETDGAPGLSPIIYIMTYMPVKTVSSTHLKSA